MFYRFTRSSEWWTAWYFGPMRQDPKPWALFNWEDPVLSPCTCTDSVWWSDVKWSEVKRKPYATELCIYSISYLFIDLKLSIDIFDISIYLYVCIYIYTYIYNHIHIHWSRWWFQISFPYLGRFHVDKYEEIYPLNRYDIIEIWKWCLAIPINLYKKWRGTGVNVNPQRFF